MVTIKIEKEFMEWIIGLINSIIKEFKAVGLLSEDTKFLRHKFKNRKRKSHSIKLVRDVETDYIIFNIDVKLLKDSLLLMRKIIHKLMPSFVGIKSFLNIFSNKDNEINNEFVLFKDIWKDRYIYCVFDYVPKDENKYKVFFKDTQFIAKTIDRDEWEVVHIKYGQPKDNKKRNLIENDIKRTIANNVQRWINDITPPVGETFDTFEQAKYRLLNGSDEPDITIPQDEFKEEKK